MEWGDQGALIQMMGHVQCRGRMASCCRMHRELILSHGEKRRHPYVEMDGLAFQLTSQFGPVDFGLCVGCQTVLQKSRQQHVLNGLTQMRKRTYLSTCRSQFYFPLPLQLRSKGPRAVPLVSQWVQSSCNSYERPLPLRYTAKYSERREDVKLNERKYVYNSAYAKFYLGVCLF